MAELVRPQFMKKEEKKEKLKGDLALDKVLAPGKHGAGAARYTLTVDSPITGVEASYFAILRLLEDRPPFGLNYQGPFGRIEKLKDVYTAGETSAYWGSIEQRKGAQQEKFQQLMASVGQLLKTLFQLIRELRIIDERLDYYEKTYAGDKNAEVALKSIWVDMVEGGGKNPTSVLGLGQQVGFVTLPDLFFTVHPATEKDVEFEVSKLEAGFNRKVREVLTRKLMQYLFWREKTYKELKQGQSFKIKYLRQHYHVIRLYMNWLRPYLRNIQRLQMQGTATDKDIIAAFETSKIEVEILAIKTKYAADTDYGKEEKEFKQFFPCVRVRLNYVAMPQMAFQEEYQRGPIHRGRTTIKVDAFVLEKSKYKDDLEEYKQQVAGEDLELLAAVDDSILALKDDLEYYLIKAGEIKKEEEKEKKEEHVFTPIKSVYLGFKEIVGIPQTSVFLKAGKKNVAEKKMAEDTAKNDAYLVYNLYKKTNSMMTE